MDDPWRIRSASPDDAPVFRRIHHSAVHGQPDARAEPPGDSDALRRTRADLSRPGLAVWLAETPDGAPAGFAMLDAPRAQVLALYVCARHAGRGLGLCRLELERSRQAAPLYARNGFQALSDGTLEIGRTGVRIPFVRMARDLRDLP